MVRQGKRIPFSERRRKHKALGNQAPRFSLAIGPRFGRQSRYSAVLPFRRSPVAILVSGLFLVAFSFPLVGVVGQLFSDMDDSLFSLVAVLFTFFWGLGWSVAVVILASVFLLLSFGRETLEVTDSELILRIGIPGMGFGARYPGIYIRAFRQESPDESLGTGWRGDHLAFDFAGDEVGFGSAVSTVQAQQMLNQLRELFPEHAEPLPDLPRPEEVPREVTHQSNAVQDSREGTLAMEPLRWNSLSSLALIGANCIPLLGVLVLNWNVGEIMLLFWAESAVIGFYNLLKMAKIGGWATLMYGPFFVGHYGGFMAGHLLFIYGFFGDNFGDAGDPGIAQLLADFIALAPALLAFFISHGVSYIRNFLGRREFEGKEIAAQMGQPYRRIIIMHMTIIFGGFLVMMFETTLPALLLMLALKIIADLRSHLREHGNPVSA